ncbi:MULTISPECIES: DUF3073 family protein [Actinopolyspora]|uniref:DUF3073 domain-containing protein n=1 Tax=Actinopolyspora saharensis TaxID=995062 RepID=A0A1H1AGV6_9ACTN|nr:DUF3073 family protein [Actinopolyspora sp. BKK2]NHE76137.1 DUF3073 family protein [Actinopolyspora sp. BKK1]SDQ38857.1 Protein of unknown function [Actinopolyspora saharensis]
MGRKRAKAKQAKIARELKYSSPPLDIEALQDELAEGDSEDEDEDDEGESRDSENYDRNSE